MIIEKFEVFNLTTKSTVTHVLMMGWTQTKDYITQYLVIKVVYMTFKKVNENRSRHEINEMKMDT